MKRVYIEDRQEMTWVCVAHIMKSGKPGIGMECGKFSDERIEAFENWCKANGYNYMVAETI